MSQDRWVTLYVPMYRSVHYVRLANIDSVWYTFGGPDANDVRWYVRVRRADQDKYNYNDFRIDPETAKGLLDTLKPEDYEGCTPHCPKCHAISVHFENDNVKGIECINNPEHRSYVVKPTSDSLVDAKVLTAFGAGLFGNIEEHDIIC